MIIRKLEKGEPIEKSYVVEENVFTKDTLVKLKGGKSNADLMNDVNYLKLIYPYFKEQVEYLLKIAKRNDLLLKITGGSV